MALDANDRECGSRGEWLLTTSPTQVQKAEAAVGGRVRRVKRCSRAVVRGAHFLEHDALAVGRATEGVALELSPKVSLLVGLVGPPLLPAHSAQLARRVQSTRLACAQRTKGWASLSGDAQAQMLDAETCRHGGGRQRQAATQVGHAPGMVK